MREPKICSVCGGRDGIGRKSKPPYKCGNCLYLEACPDEKLRLFSEELERANQGWAKMNAEAFYRSIARFVKDGKFLSLFSG